ncbi:hypothetical protein OESDEN_17989 [Oesophagostomum dentatum]|uniref:Uncharacterized protein n=1 Tax=Oesophagostomum dentatum TaxID=61180 RepID=A0A0B1SAI7_OESDE|nr:hypothetical protein OESDEN_17989 [Oesophagostomum dentatum]
MVSPPCLSALCCNRIGSGAICSHFFKVFTFGSFCNCSEFANIATTCFCTGFDHNDFHISFGHLCLCTGSILYTLPADIPRV